jgi:arylsulfatase A-like enzyme
VSKRPNILLITTDQQRGDCLGCAGHPVLETPYLDDLAAQGCRFSRAYSAVPSCIPARAAILTGMNQWNHGRLAMLGTDHLKYPATLPGELTKNGYQTRAVGKMHFHPQRAHYGFEHMVLDESSRRQGKFVSDYHQWLESSGNNQSPYRDHSIAWNSWVALPSAQPEEAHPTAWTTAEGVHFLKNRDNTRPFFLWLSYARPHAPYDAPARYFNLYDKNPNVPEPLEGDWCGHHNSRNDDVNAGRGKRSASETARARAGYYGNITFIDHQIGRLLFELKKHDPEAARNTLILFTSDHGDMLGDHCHWRKSVPYEGAMHVPFLLVPPPSWERFGQSVVDAPVEMQDILPTLLDAAGVEIPANVNGSSLLPVARSKDVPAPREWLLCEHNQGTLEGWQCATDGREKFIWFHHTGNELFFDLQTDPGELHNLTSTPEKQDRITLWRQRLAQANEERGDSRGKDGKLIPWLDKDPNDPALSLTPKYFKWKLSDDEELGIQPD